MADCMNFPNSFEEFINGYSFKDSDEVYTNGSELIPTFRVMQGYEHFEKMISAEERTKTIDEFVKAIRESNKGHWRTIHYEHGESVCETMSYDIGVIKNIAEQLKER